MTTRNAEYGPVKSENVPVGVTNAETPEAAEDDHGMAALRKKRARGGKVQGDKPKFRLDRRAKGGKVNGKGTKINIVIAPQGGGAGGPPGPMPGAGMPPSAAPPVPPPRPPMPPQAAGAPPMVPPGPMRKDGGRVPHMTASAANGEGRLEKARIYGKNARGAAK